MPPKRRAPAKDSSSEPKRKRKMMTISEKVKLLDMLKQGRSYAVVARHYGVNESTVRYIKKDEADIRKTAAISFNKEAKRVVTPRNKRIVKMEAALALWVADYRKKNVSLDTNMIRTKAKSLYDQTLPDDDDKGDAEEAAEDDPDELQASTSSATSDSPPRGRGFTASKGWFDKFQKRYGLKSVPLYGEAASAETDAARRYVEDEFPKLISDDGYLPEQVFNMDETGLFWKRMPSRTFLFKDEVKRPGFKAHKDRVTLIMCGNAAGFMLKPGLIYKAKNPRALKNKNKALLPVYWMHNSKAWITKALTLEWFLHCFIPQVKLYLAQKGLPFKVLLLMDCAGGHATALQYDGVQIEFLPPNTTSLIQPMDQGVIRAFKALYTRSTMEGLIAAVDDEEGFTLKKYWRNYNIASCLTNIQQALKDMKTETINSCWKKLWPNVVHDYAGFTPDEVHHSAVEKAVRLARIIRDEGFVDMTEEDVNGLIDAHSDPLTDEDLLEMMKSASEEESEEEQDEEIEERGLTLENLQQLCNMARAMQRFAQDIDDNMVRAVEFSNRVDGVMSLYKGILQQKKKQRQQLPITMFFSKMGPKKVREKSQATKKMVRITIDVKKEIIEKYERGMRVTDLAVAYRMPRTTISTIVKKKEAIKSANVAKGVKFISKQRSQTLEKVEKLLLIWINEKQLAGNSVSEAIICEKAKMLHADLLKDMPGTSEDVSEVFKASHGWFDNFKKRTGIHCVMRHGEAASVNKDDSKEFDTEFGEFVEAEGFNGRGLSFPKITSPPLPHHHPRRPSTPLCKDMACAVATPVLEPNGDFPAWLEAQGVNTEVARAMDSELGIRDYGVLRACVGDGLVRAELLATARDRLPFGFYAVLRQVVKALRGAEPHDGAGTPRWDDAAASSPGDVTLGGLVEVLLALLSGLSRELLLSMQRLDNGDYRKRQVASSLSAARVASEDEPAEMDQFEQNGESEETLIPASNDNNSTIIADQIKMEPFQALEQGSGEMTLNEIHDKMGVTSASVADDSMVQIKTEAPEGMISNSVTPLLFPEALEQGSEELTLNELHDKMEVTSASVADDSMLQIKTEVPEDEETVEPSSGFIIRLVMPMQVDSQVVTSSSPHDGTTQGLSAGSHVSRTVPSTTATITPPLPPVITTVTTMTDNGTQIDRCFAEMKPDMQEQFAQPRASIIAQQPAASTRGNKLYFCNLCGQGFTQNAMLNIHLRKHTCEKLYICAMCGRGFSSSTNLNIHERTHTGEKPYRCGVCGQAFTQPNSLKRHQRMHTGEKPYRCGVCGQAFTSKPNMIYHQGKHLSQTPPQPLPPQ
ncbi:uncharacterized protein LOC133359240 isoform X2 [Lethenteron reissneri]|uniref:uncharacterized protein LOC133359240 isoform X2 n=1 Tax=Lethenteron reissneri TaxID=7753 RepID=UPI002AB630CE|nr:uncharacterized protein LOC133359240 isoform X2 [Lethenteron reissneri]